MKLVVSIVRDEDAAPVIDALTDAEMGATRINTAGGFLKRGNATILTGVDDNKVDTVMRIVKERARTATIFVLNVSRFEHL